MPPHPAFGHLLPQSSLGEKGLRHRRRISMASAIWSPASTTRSAANARTCGFDGIAIHGAHGYMVDDFLWEGTNQRTDRWGGDHVGRAAFAVELVKAIRGAGVYIPG